MDLVLEVRTGRDRVTMACRGQLIGGKEAEAFRRSALLLLGGFDTVIINLAGVRHADREGWNCLASLLAAADEKGKQVRITHAAHLHMETTGITDPMAEPQPVHDRAEAVA
jgi:ABC-type transporter Mla MlaB component